jgi:D-alanine-D-alanine ligase
MRYGLLWPMRISPRCIMVEQRELSRAVASRDFRHDVAPSDADAVRRIVASTGFFSPAEVDVAVELIEDRLTKGDRSEYRFIFADSEGSPAGYVCYGPIACTIGSYDLYWIAVHDKHRGGGLGTKLMAEAQRVIAIEGGRRIYVETSSRPQYQPTREFYLKCGYRIEATLEDFYSQGDAKVILVKSTDHPTSVVDCRL